MEVVFSFIRDSLLSAINMLNSASVWILASFAVSGLVHEFIGADRMKKSALGSTRPAGLFWATVTGMFLPICSCGTIPLGISMYYSGAYLGPVLTFMTSTPMINPIAVILAFGLLGKDIAIIYILAGFFGPFIIGLIANKLAGDELYYKPAYENSGMRIKLNLKAETPPLAKRIKRGFRWAFTELSSSISKYSVTGMLIGGVIFTVVPQSAIQRYLGEPGMVSLLGITVVASLMYVCAVGHIPFIAALVASGAAPGVAATFLMAGCATNIAELLSIRKTIGKRAMALYLSTVVILSLIVGHITNVVLSDFKPVLDYDAVTHSITYANRLIVSFPEWLKYLCSAVIIGYAVIAYKRVLKKKLAPK